MTDLFKDKDFATRAVRAGQQRTHENEHSEPMFLTSSYVFDSAEQAAARFSGDEVVFNPYGAVKEMGSVSLINIEQKVKIIEVRPSGFVKIK